MTYEKFFTEGVVGPNPVRLNHIVSLMKKAMTEYFTFYFDHFYEDYGGPYSEGIRKCHGGVNMFLTPDEWSVDQPNELCGTIESFLNGDEELPHGKLERCDYNIVFDYRTSGRGVCHSNGTIGLNPRFFIITVYLKDPKQFKTNDLVWIDIDPSSIFTLNHELVHRSQFTRGLGKQQKFVNDYTKHYTKYVQQHTEMMANAFALAKELKTFKTNTKVDKQQILDAINNKGRTAIVRGVERLMKKPINDLKSRKKRQRFMRYLYAYLNKIL